MIDVATGSVLARHPLIVQVDHLICRDLAIDIGCRCYEMKVGGCSPPLIFCGLSRDIIGHLPKAMAQILIPNPANTCYEGFFCIKGWSIDAPHSNRILIICGIAFRNASANESTSLQPKLLLKLIYNVLKIVARPNRLCNHLVET